MSQDQPPESDPRPAAAPEAGAAEGATPSAGAGGAGPRGGGPGSTKLVIGFTWRFVVAVGILSTATYVDEAVFDGAAVLWLTSGVAGAVVWTLNAAGFPATVSGNEIIYNFHVFKIIEECVGLDVLELFAAAVLAFPVAWKDRLRGLLIGLPILFFINYVRMITLVFIGVKSNKALEIGHVYVWPLIVIAVAIGLWLSWAWSTTDEASPRT